MNCLVLEDQQIFLDLLASMVESFSEISTVFKADSIKAASQISHEQTIDLAILDIYLPDGHCNDLAQHLVFQNPDIKIIILSGAAQEFVCPEGLKEAIYGIVDKTDAFDALNGASYSCSSDEFSTADIQFQGNRFAMCFYR